MAIVQTSDLTYLLRTMYAPQISETVYREDALFDMPGGPGEEAAASVGGRKLSGLIPYVPTDGGTSLNWPVEYASDDAEEFSEMQVAQAPAGESITQATQSPRNFRTVLKISGDSLAAATSEAALVSILSEKMTKRWKALRDTINTTLLGTGSGNIQAIVDSTSTYAGISSRSTYGWDSEETAVGGALALSDLEDLAEALELKGGDIENDYVWVMRSNQLTNVNNLAGWEGNSVVQRYTDTGGKFDPGFIRSQTSIFGIPVVTIGSLTSTVIMLLHIPSFEWRIHVPLIVEEKPTEEWSYRWDLITSIFLRCKTPHLSGKLTGVTA